MSDGLALERAALQARLARERLFDTAHELQARLDPNTLIDEAVEGVKSTASGFANTTADAARRRPGVAAGAAGVALLLVIRKPLGRLFRRKPKRDETD